MKITLFNIIFFIAGSSIALAQSRKDIVNNKVKSQTTYEVDYENSNGKEVREKYEKYDTIGNLIELIEYDEKGKVIDHEKYTYNDNNEIIKEEKLDDDGKIVKTIEYVFNNGLKTEKITYDEAGRMIKVKKFIYEYHKVEKK